MEDIKILNNGSRDENRITISLSADRKVNGVESDSRMIDEYKVYCNERDSSDIYRLIATIKPVCSNILFNAKTEIIYKEGSNDCHVVHDGENGWLADVDDIVNYFNYKGIDDVSSVKTIEFIRDTAFSSKYAGGLEYKCGADIFNNHYFRSDEFFVVNKLDSNSAERKYFNTLFDYARDEKGAEITEKIPKIESGNLLKKNEIHTHLYQNDTVKSFQFSMDDNLVECDGWVGFVNKAVMDINNYVYNGEEVSLNKCMNNCTCGTQVDMYPDRSLYSFNPKFNRYRNREERNWDYCLTYPYRNEYNSLVLRNGCNGIECFIEGNLKGTVFENPMADSSNLVKIRSMLNNNFKRGDFITATIIDTSKSKKYSNGIPFMVENISEGSDNRHYFYVKSQFIISLLSDYIGDINSKKEDDEKTSYSYKYSPIDDEGKLLSRFKIIVRKNIGGNDCEYYLRVFKRIPNFKGIAYDSENYSKEEKDPCKNDFSSNLNKLAFSKTVYNDDISQIVFSDDIDVSGLKNNLGMRLSRIYLTVVKRNAGHDEWYKSRDYGNEKIEYSHCFGEVSSGFDLSPDDTAYNVRKMHNVQYHHVDSPSPLEKNVIINPSTSEFIGDIVEFDKYSLNEEVIEPVYHRFNTAQREFTSKNFGTIECDDIVSDDYDPDGFSGHTTVFHNNTMINRAPEGYYYKPHYEIKICELSEKPEEGCHTKMSFIELGAVSDVKNVFTGMTAVPYYVQEGDTIYAYRKNSTSRKEGKILYVGGPLYTEVRFELTIGQNERITDYRIFKHNDEMPKYSYELNDGSGRYLWKKIVPYDELDRTEEVYNMVFTNGAKYCHKNIEFYLKRQDPEGKYGLNRIGTIDWYTGASDCTIKDVSVAEYEEEGVNTIC